MPEKFFCPLPWNSVDVGPLKGMRPCCDYRIFIYADSVEDYFNSYELKQVQQEILQGTVPKGCSKCNYREQFGDSKRILTLERQGVSCIKDTITDRILALDVKPTNKCNMACISCTPYDSSLVHHECKTKHPLDHYKEIFDKYQVENTRWNDDLIDQLLSRLDDHATLHLTGGEPGIAKECLRILETLVERQQTSVTIKIHSNFQTHTDQFIDLLSNFDNIIMRASIDAIGEQAEYIRYYSKWDLIEKNILNFKSRFPQAVFTINPAISIMNIWHLHELERWCDKHDLELVTNNLLVWPDYLEVNIHDEYKQSLLATMNFPSNIRKTIDRPFDIIKASQCRLNLERNDKNRKQSYMRCLPTLYAMLNNV